MRAARRRACREARQCFIEREHVDIRRFTDDEALVERHALRRAAVGGGLPLPGRAGRGSGASRAPQWREMRPIGKRTRLFRGQADEALR